MVKERMGMNSCDIESVANTIAYIEAHLQERLDLDRVATDIHYSKFHLHRMFTQATGITIHDYIRRRQLTEAARHLVFSEKPVLEIALSAGYGSQQAFLSPCINKRPWNINGTGIFTRCSWLLV